MVDVVMSKDKLQLFLKGKKHMEISPGEQGVWWEPGCGLIKVGKEIIKI